jgi:hypothetical protein
VTDPSQEVINTLTVRGDATRPQIGGAEQVAAFFGGWPSFHDAEVLQLSLVRDGISKLVLSAACYSVQTDENGIYRREGHVLVTFSLECVVDLHLEDFRPHNVLSSLTLEQRDGPVALTLQPNDGLAGRITCKRVLVSLEPGAQQ